MAEDGAMPQADGYSGDGDTAAADANLARDLADRMEDAWELQRWAGHAHIHPTTPIRVIQDAIRRFDLIHVRDGVLVCLRWRDLTIRFQRM